MEIITQEQEDRAKIYEWSYRKLLHIHRNPPTVLEVVIYMATISKESVDNILKIMKKQEQENRKNNSQETFDDI